jgi:4-aminobutyrate aminotransferase
VVDWEVLSRSEAPHLVTEIPGPNARIAVERDHAVTSPSLPLGAVIARAELMSWLAGHHGSTFSGNPVSCAAALTTLDVILEGGLLENAEARGAEFRAAFGALASSRPSVITDVRGRGLMIGIEFVTGDLAHEFEQRCFERGVLVLTCGERTVRVSPVLTSSAQQVVAAMRVIDPVVGAL